MRRLLIILVFVNLSLNLISSTIAIKKGSKIIAFSDSIQFYDSLSFLNVVRNDELSIKFARKELLLSKKTNEPYPIAKAYMSLGAAFSKTNEDSSLFYYHILPKIEEK